jgi:YD repeat-containing protein
MLAWLLSLLFFVLGKVICLGEFQCVMSQQQEVCIDLVKINSPSKLLLVSSNLSSRIRDAQPTPGAQREDQIATYTDGSAKVWTSTYDARNRKLTERDGLNRTTTYAYDVRDNKIRITPPKNTPINFEYDIGDRLTKVTNALGQASVYAYNTRNNRTQLTDPLGRITKWTYGRSDRLLKQEWPAVNSVTASRSYTFDAAGNVLSETTENGAVLTYTFDALNRRTNLATSGGAPLAGEVISTAYTLDANGNVLTIAETLADTSIKTETKTFDVEGRLKTVLDRNGKLRSYAYDATDNRITETDHDSTVVNHTYDARNRLASTTSTELGATTYLYDNANRLTETAYANLAKEVRGFDLAGQLTSLKHERAGGTLHSEVFGYDTNGNRTTLTQNDGTTNRVTTYTFDTADRLLTEANPEERLEDTLDAAGNRTQRLVKNGTGVLQKTITYTMKRISLI